MHHLMRTLVLWLTLGVLCSPIQADQLNDRFNATKRLAEKGQANAMYQLGQMYELGMGVANNRGKAYEWYLKAAKQGQPSAAYQVGYAYYWGKAGRPKDRDLAFQWFSKAADSGNHLAMTYLSKMYAIGQGTKRDKEQSVVWADRARQAERLAAEQAAAAPPAPVKATPKPVEPKPAPKVAEAVADTTSQNTPDKAIVVAKAETKHQASQARPVKQTKPAKQAKVEKKKARTAKAERKPATQKRIMAGVWHKGGRPASFLPSEQATCKQVKNVLRCATDLMTDHQYGTPFRYRFISTLSDFSRKGAFSVDFRAQLIDVLAKEEAGYSASEDEEAAPEATPTTIADMLTRRQDQLSCRFTASDRIECTNGRGKKQRFSRT